MIRYFLLSLAACALVAGLCMSYSSEARQADYFNRSGATK